jgi:ribosomal protein L40E
MMEDIPIYKVNNTTVAVSTDLGIDLSWLGNISTGTIIIVFAILLFLIILVLLWRWRRLKIMPASPTVPCDGKTPLPVRVMFVNGFGLKRRPRTNVDVAMEATAGSIQNVVLPISKDSVEAMLVPSKEFGPVMVTAKAGKKKARAAVSFVCDGGSLDISASPETIPASSDSSSNVRIRVRDRNGNYVAPLQDMVVGLSSTLGGIAGSVKIPARSTEVYTVLKAGDKSGTAVIKASGSLLTGEGRVNFQGTARRFCMHCGATMTMEAAKCPKCGLTPPSGVDVKQCPTCGTVIPMTAKYCHSCGVVQ